MDLEADTDPDTDSEIEQRSEVSYTFAKGRLKL